MWKENVTVESKREQVAFFSFSSCICWKKAFLLLLYVKILKNDRRTHFQSFIGTAQQEMGFFDLHEPEDGQDYFFLYAMIIVPFLSSGAYLFDAWYYYVTKPKVHTYEGLLSTIVIVFSYLQYCAPIRSRKARCIYHILLWIINEVATLGYLLYYIRAGYTFKIIVYVCF